MLAKEVAKGVHTSVDIPQIHSREGRPDYLASRLIEECFRRFGGRGRRVLREIEPLDLKGFERGKPF
jgi:hypothetical protein